MPWCILYLRYGILIWGNASQSVLDPLQILVNKAARIMVSAPFGNIDLNPAYDYLKILNVTKTFLLETGKYHYKFVNQLLPTQIGNFFDTSATQAARHTYNLRNRGSNKPLRFFSKSKIGEKSNQYRGTQIWNAIPLEIKNCELFTKFKTLYKNHLLKNEVDSIIFLNQTDLLLFS